MGDMEERLVQSASAARLKIACEKRVDTRMATAQEEVVGQTARRSAQRV
jgi:hypothetical protein